MCIFYIFPQRVYYYYLLSVHTILSKKIIAETHCDYFILKAFRSLLGFLVKIKCRDKLRSNYLAYWLKYTLLVPSYVKAVSFVYWLHSVFQLSVHVQWGPIGVGSNSCILHQVEFSNLKPPFVGICWVNQQKKELSILCVCVSLSSTH